MPDGRQLPIRVDLARAMTDQKERILIQANDVVMLQFKPGQAVFNGALNFVNFNFLTSASQ
jgi:ATP-dependent protease HslVU (ClpYQ) ATPase subunit